MHYSTNIKKTGLFKMGKTLACSLVIMSCLLFQSCETEIPKCDTTPPNFSFRITGDGFNHTFTQADVESFRLNLRTGAIYKFVYAGYDAGGMERMDLFVHNSVDFEPLISHPWSVFDEPPYRRAGWQGDAAPPVTGSLLTGTLRVSDVPGRFLIVFSLKDFGGRSCPPNSMLRHIQIRTGDYNTEIVPIPL
jgi:hypothetical protein